MLNAIPFNMILGVVFWSIITTSNAQTESQYFGNGISSGVKITSSDNYGSDSANTSLKGNTYVEDEAQSVRFLQQSTLGYNLEDVQYLHRIGIESWIDEQMNMPLDGLNDNYWEFIDYAESIGATITLNSDGYTGYTYYDWVLKADDQLRQRVAFVLSQILVASFDTDVTDRMSHFMTDYYDIFYYNAFGNFNDILHEVTMHRTMGLYLSYLNNKKEDPIMGTYPDENYAREIMQLFTIGLNELNLDGTLKLDANGNNIPTYDNEDIVQLAKVFTGLVIDRNSYDMLTNDDDHDMGPKIMIDGSVLPANQTTMQDINDAIAVLFNHDNVAPFISTHLIKHLVKSNPSPQYVARVATVFNNNGQGVRGDLGAVIKAILLDTEARDCVWMNDPSTGRLLQPIEKFMFMFNALHLSSPSGRIHLRDYWIWSDQRILGAPSVFNYFSPFYAEPEVVAPEGLVSPEFEIFNSVGSVSYYNDVRSILKDIARHANFTVSNDDGNGLDDNKNNDPLGYDLSYEESLYENEGVAALVDHYNLLLCRNQMTEQTQKIIENAITEYQNNVSGYNANKAVTDVVLFMMTSPTFCVIN